MFGLDLLGACSPHWDVASTVVAFPPGWALGTFGPGWNGSFGTDTTNIATICTQAKVAAVRFHMWWDDNHLPAPLAFIQKWAPHYEDFAKKFPNIKILLSPSCEYGNTTTLQDIEGWLATIRKLAPSCTPVLSPEGGSLTYPGVRFEWHGTNSSAGPGQHSSLGSEDSTDGNDLPNIDAATWVSQNEKADICFLWGYLFNMNPGNNVEPPSARTYSPGISYIKGITALSNPIGANPPVSFSSIPLIKPNLWKTFSDWDGNTTPRDFKPLLWLENEPGDPVSVITSKGTTIATLGFFNDVRWYSGQAPGSNLWAFEIKEAAVAEAGSPWVWFKTKAGKIYGPVNAAFRAPFFES